MIRLMGADVWALTLHDENLDREQVHAKQKELRNLLGIPVVHPLWEGVEALVDEIQEHLAPKDRT